MPQGDAREVLAVEAHERVGPRRALAVITVGILARVVGAAWAVAPGVARPLVVHGAHQQRGPLACEQRAQHGDGEAGQVERNQTRQADAQEVVECVRPRGRRAGNCDVAVAVAVVVSEGDVRTGIGRQSRQLDAAGHIQAGAHAKLRPGHAHGGQQPQRGVPLLQCDERDDQVSVQQRADRLEDANRLLHVDADVHSERVRPPDAERDGVQPKPHEVDLEEQDERRLQQQDGHRHAAAHAVPRQVVQDGHVPAQAGAQAPLPPAVGLPEERGLQHVGAQRLGGRGPAAGRPLGAGEEGRLVHGWQRAADGQTRW